MSKREDGPVEDFFNDGFTIFPNVVSPSDIEELRSRYFAMHSAASKNEGGETNSEGIVNICPALEFVRLDKLASSKLLTPDLGAWLRTQSEHLLQGKSSQITIDLRIFHKPAFANGTLRHQDDAYRMRKNCSLTFWIPLDPVNTQNGCLIYERGSHGLGELPHIDDPSDLSGETLTIDSEEFPALDRYDAAMKLGDISVHSPLVVHGSHKNGTDQPRRALVAIATIERQL